MKPDPTHDWELVRLPDSEYPISDHIWKCRKCNFRIWNPNLDPTKVTLYKSCDEYVILGVIDE